MRLLFVNRQLQFSHHASHCAHGLFGVGAVAADHEIIRVIDDLRLKTLLVSEHLPSQNESPHIEIRQQR